MFDLPSKTKIEKSKYVRFRTFLLNKGFGMLQYSVYAKYYESRELLNSHIKDIEFHIPPDGDVTIMSLTEKQFKERIIFVGKHHYDAVDQQLEQFVLL